jgi:uncharacterized membrane protein
MSEAKGNHHHGTRAQRYLLAGVFTVIPLWITWVVFDFFLGQLSRVGTPWVRTLSRGIQHEFPSVARWLLEPWFQSVLAILLTLAFLYLLGWAVTQVVGKRVMNLLESGIARLPYVQTVYGSTKKLIAALQREPGRVQRVVLIEFPTPEMKAVGFVTRILRDDDTGQELAAVYVPTTPNPTSGYLEIVPLERVVGTDWTIEEAMTFIISGGAVAPESLSYTCGVHRRQASEAVSDAASSSTLES